MLTADIRRAFLDYFVAHGHREVESSSLVPINDPTLLFTNAGMVQFKETFLGAEKRDYQTATTSQRCVRAGGKHNDLDNVGYTARHHTFFEMLGNFSFGDYFKREAIGFAWELLTETYALPVEKLWVTVFRDDDEAAAIWLDEIGVDPARFSRCGEEDNFWSMGDTGPCGPCSEIFFDHGSEIPGGPPGSPEADGDRYIEIWNLVFMQYDRDAQGNMTPLPRPSVDTGMGLERIAAVLQGVHNNYDIDLFKTIIAAVTELAPDGESTNSSRVIADHIRSCAFLVLDGVMPSNEGRGYVLRRIIRRALRHGHKLGITEPFFNKLVPTLSATMGEAFPGLRAREAQVMETLALEERRFSETLAGGMKILEAAVADLSGKTIPGKLAFELYDTYGFPLDLTADFARERQLDVDTAGFDIAMEEQRDLARSASKFGIDQRAVPDTEALNAIGEKLAGAQPFSGYDSVTDEAVIEGVFKGAQGVGEAGPGDEAAIVLATTPFYAESGGQIGDIGRLEGEGFRFEVEDTQKQQGLHLHQGRVSTGVLKIGDTVRATIDDERRSSIRRNHSATHLLHAALRSQLGLHVEQKGSLVDAERLRFDFSNPSPLRPEQLDALELEVNEKVRLNALASATTMGYQEAVDSGAVALFGEKYGDEVRVMKMGDSVELCGGTHVERTGDIGLFKIVAETGVASGVRRIEAVTGAQAITLEQQQSRLLRSMSAALRANPNEMMPKLVQALERTKQMEKEIQNLKGQLATQGGKDIADSAITVGGAELVAEVIPGADMETLRTTCDRLKDKLDNAVVVLAAVDQGKVRIVAGVAKALTKQIKAGDLANFVAGQVGGKGGGRPDMAQVGGNQPEQLPQAIGSVAAWVGEQLT
ncbi:MAG: alanine--tRNA ligase [Pseudomonadota bacterium]